MKNTKAFLTTCAFGAMLVTTSVFAEAEMSRDFRNTSGIDVTRFVEPNYTSCTPDVHKDEKGSTTFRGSKGSECHTYYHQDPDPKRILRDRD